MSLLKLKETVIVPRTVIIAAAVINAANTLDLSDMLITSGNDGIHMSHSKHYTDAALDFRTKHLAPEAKHLLLSTAKFRLGRDYDLVLEDENGPNEHLHVEYDPKPHS